MRQLTRSWPALAALGAALLFGAVGAGAIGANVAVGSLWIVLALMQAVFGVQSLRGARLPSPALTLTFFLIPVLLWAALIMIAPLLGLSERSRHAHEATAGAASLRLPSEVMVLPLLPLLIASALSLGVAAWAACEMRVNALRATDAAAHQPAAGGRFVTGLLLGALAVSALVTPGLAATDAGRLAVPHGEHSSGAQVDG